MNFGAATANDKLFPKSNKAFFSRFCVQHSKYLYLWENFVAGSRLLARTAWYLFWMFVFVECSDECACVRPCVHTSLLRCECLFSFIVFLFFFFFFEFHVFTTNYSILFESLENNFIGHTLSLTHLLRGVHIDFRQHVTKWPKPWFTTLPPFSTTKRNEQINDRIWW